MCIGLLSVPRLMCAEMIHECLVGYSTRIGWNSTNYIFLPCAKMCRRRNLKRKSNCECCASLFTVFVYTACLRSVPYGVSGVKSGRLFGWLINLLAVPDSGFTFHSSLIGSRTTSLILQDLIFPVAWFSMCR